MTEEAQVLLQLMLMHRDAAANGNESRRYRLFDLIEEFEWAFPDALAEIDEKVFPPNG